MHHPLSSLIDQIVQNAEKEGAFEDLAGKGKPLVMEGNPQDAVLHRIMSEADAKAPVAILRAQIVKAQDDLKALTDPVAIQEAKLSLSELHTKLGVEMDAFRKYG